MSHFFSSIIYLRIVCHGNTSIQSKFTLFKFTKMEFRIQTRSIFWCIILILGHIDYFDH